MGILSRISKVLESNLNALVDRAEDPAKILDQAIEDMKKGKKEAEEAIIQARTQKRLSEKKKEKAEAESREYEQKAMRALEIGDETLARKLLELKLQADERATLEENTTEQHDTYVAQLEQAKKELDQRLRELPAKKAALMSRQATAQARGARVGAQSKANNSVADAMEAFDRMEERIIRAEVEAEVKGELEPGLSAGLDLRAIEDHKAEQELLKLKAKMAAQLSAGTEKKSGPTEGASADPIEDSLSQLKAKLQDKKS